MDHEEYSEAIKDLGHSLPWFGDKQIAVPKKISSTDIKNRTVPAIRRILLSLLAGRPYTQAAARVPTSRRTLYKILTEVIYRWKGDLNQWIELGLIAIWDAPVNKLDLEKIPSWHWDMCEGSPIYCLLCHRVIDYTFFKNRAYDSSLVHPEDGRFHENPIYEYDAAKSHMICHFLLNDTPKPNRMQIKLKSPKKKYYRAAPRSWLFEKPEGFSKIWNKFDLKAPLPLTRGRKPSHDSVEKHYLSLL